MKPAIVSHHDYKSSLRKRLDAIYPDKSRIPKNIGIIYRKFRDLDLSEVDRGLATLNNDFSRNRTFGINSTFESNDYKSNKMMNDMVSALNKMNDNGQPSTNYFTFNVDGAENPEEFAQRFVRQIQLEMRTG